MRVVLRTILLYSGCFALSLASGGDLEGGSGVEVSNLRVEERKELGGVAENVGLGQGRAENKLEILNYMDLSSRVIKEDVDELIGASLSGIGGLKMSLEVLNKTQLWDLESAFNETHFRYRGDLEALLERSSPGKKGWFSNIDVNSQEKLKDLLVQRDEASKSGRKVLKSVPLNYVTGMDVDKWYPLLDSINIFAISMLSEDSTKKQGRRLERRELHALVERVSSFLVFSSMVTSGSSCRQIAWRLVVGESRHLSILNGLSKKLLKRSQSSVSLLKRRNEPVIREHNAIVSKGQELDSNLKGLLDLVIKARSDRLDSLVLVEDVAQDLQALKAHYLELWEERSRWIASNKGMVKAFTEWLQLSVGLVYRVALGLSKSVIAYNIRNWSDLVYTLSENGDDLDKVREEVEKSLDAFGFALKALRTGVTSMRHEEHYDIFRRALRKLEDHFKWLSKGYLETWREVSSLVSKRDPRAQLEEFLASSRDLVNQLWRSDLKSQLTLSSAFEAGSPRIPDLFKRVGEFLRSESISRHLEMQNAVLRLRHYNEMLFPDLRLQIELVDREKERVSTTGAISWEVLEHFMSRTFMNESIEKCSTDYGRVISRPTLRLGISSSIMARTSIWEEDSLLISGEEELSLLSVDFLVAKKSRSLVKKRQFPHGVSSPGEPGGERGVSRNEESLEKLLALKERLMELNANLKRELEALGGEDSGLGSVTKSLLDKVQKLEKHIQTLELTISNIESSDQESLSQLLGVSQSLLTGQGAPSDTLESRAKQISARRANSEVSRLRRELAGFKTGLDKDLRLVKRISRYSSDISALDDNIKVMERYLSQLQARIDLFCGRIDRDGGGPRTSRALSILKYTIRRRRPDTECEGLTLEFSKTKEGISSFLNSASELVSEYYVEFRGCNELGGISSRLSDVVVGFQKAKKELQALQSAYLDKSLEQGTKILEKSLQKLSQDSKKVSKEIKCYVEIDSVPEIVTLYIKKIKGEIFKLQNTIERELNTYIFEKKT